MSGFEGLSPTVKVNGSPLSETVLQHLVSVRVQRSLRLPGRATLRFADVGYSVSSSGFFSIGKKVEVGVYQAGVLMTGTVTGMSLQQQVTNSIASRSMSDQPCKYEQEAAS